MISTDSVLATRDSFMVVDRISKIQWVKGIDPKIPTLLTKILNGRSAGLLIETEHFEIIASPNQKFITSKDSYSEAEDIRVGDSVLTSTGWETVTVVIPLTGLIDMASIHTMSKAFIANSFVLVCDF